MCKQGCCDGARTPTTEELLTAVDAWAFDRGFQDGVVMGLWLAGRDDVHFALMNRPNSIAIMRCIHADLEEVVDGCGHTDTSVPGLRERLAEAEQWASNPDKRGGGA